MQRSRQSTGGSRPRALACVLALLALACSPGGQNANEILSKPNPFVADSLTTAGVALEAEGATSDTLAGDETSTSPTLFLPPALSPRDRERLDRIERLYDRAKRAYPAVPDLTVQQVLDMQQSGERPLLVDTRELREQQVSMIPGAISRAAFDRERGVYRTRPIVVYCTIGIRSARYAQQLREAGFRAYNLRGSILAWVYAGRPVVDPSDHITRRIHVYSSDWNLAPEGYKPVW